MHSDNNTTKEQDGLQTSKTADGFVMRRSTATQLIMRTAKMARSVKRKTTDRKGAAPPDLNEAVCLSVCCLCMNGQ
jgi:hypothetical protein